jgi:hypothetical protein
MSESERGEIVRGAVETGIEVLELAKDLQVPGVSLGITLVQRAWQARVARQVDQFFTLLAISLRVDDANAAAELVASKIEDRATQDAIDAGFTAMMSAMTERGRRCIAALVAEYVTEARPQDAIFRRVGSVLQAAEDDDFPILGVIGEHAAGLAAATGFRYVFTNEEKKVFWLNSNTDKNWVRSAVYRRPDQFRLTVDLIKRSGLAQQFVRGEDYTVAAGRSVLQFERHQEAGFELLRRSLKPVWMPGRLPPTFWREGAGGEHNETPLEVPPADLYDPR